MRLSAPSQWIKSSGRISSKVLTKYYYLFLIIYVSLQEYTVEIRGKR